MTIEGAIADLQHLIDDGCIPEWAKPSLRKIKETVEAEKEERKKGKWIFVHPLQFNDSGAYMCSCCHHGSYDINPKTWKACPHCTALMEDEEVEE